MRFPGPQILPELEGEARGGWSDRPREAGGGPGFGIRPLAPGDSPQTPPRWALPPFSKRAPQTAAPPACPPEKQLGTRSGGGAALFYRWPVLPRASSPYHSRGEALSPLGPPALYNFSSARSAHSFQKAVRPPSLPPIRLIRSLHSRPPWVSSTKHTVSIRPL